ncbi:hypothetical protein FOL47_000740 [Perkinsus chesapeaki]|uniref:Glucose-methanol-choline oxidoreductase N-terminal domain-containing protein n=1 Tax=Perkinsus chesapeaki TaxID=330153 RepID=A0A7J6KUT1_PERCH|nr:hypothetical protein FOL47_000740 [Perkinsus chesapeaki]
MHGMLSMLMNRSCLALPTLLLGILMHLIISMKGETILSLFGAEEEYRLSPSVDPVGLEQHSSHNRCDFQHDPRSMFKRIEYCDIIIIGAGSGGSTTAARLCQKGSNKSRICLLEAGGGDSNSDGGIHPSASKEASRWWTAEVDFPLPDRSVIRTLTFVGGRVLGGSSRVNGRYWMDINISAAGDYFNVANDYIESIVGFTNSSLNIQWEPLASLRDIPDSMVAVVSNLGGLTPGPTPSLVPHPPTVVASMPRVSSCLDMSGRPDAFKCSTGVYHNVDVFANTTVTSLALDAATGLVTAAETDDVSFRGDQFIFSAGALGSPRLLLRSGLITEAVGLREHVYLPLLFAFDDPTCLKHPEEIFVFHQQWELIFGWYCEDGISHMRIYAILLHPTKEGRISSDRIVWNPLESDTDINAFIDIIRLLYNTLVPLDKVLGFSLPPSAVDDDLTLRRYIYTRLALWQHPCCSLINATLPSNILLGDLSSLPMHLIPPHPDSAARLAGAIAADRLLNQVSVCLSLLLCYLSPLV